MPYDLSSVESAIMNNGAGHTFSHTSTRNISENFPQVSLFTSDPVYKPRLLPMILVFDFLPRVSQDIVGEKFKEMSQSKKVSKTIRR